MASTEKNKAKLTPLVVSEKNKAKLTPLVACFGCLNIYTYNACSTCYYILILFLGMDYAWLI